MDLAAEYNNRELVPEHPRIIEGWRADAAAYRSAVRHDLDIAYGAGARCTLDLFYPDVDRHGPLVVFIHGGYWRSFDKSVFSHMAAGANGLGLTVAVPSYSLCPSVTLPEIIDELRQCCLFLKHHRGRPLVVTGHSAGGHLAACMAATRWENYGAEPDLVRGGLALSGIFDLRPLRATPLNDDLRLSESDAVIASPLLWPAPRRIAFDLWVGGDESFEFLRQSRSLAAAWTGLGLAAPQVVVPGKNHFTVAGAFAARDSDLARRLLTLAES